MTVIPRYVSIVGGREDGPGIAGATFSNAPLVTSAPATADTDLGVVVGADQTAVEAAIATLETDGATPTQAHVTALRAVWNTLKTDAATAKTATAALVGTHTLQGYDLVVGYDATAVATKSKFRAMLREVVLRVAGDGALSE